MNHFQSKYKVLEKIGEGSFSDVLKCENRETKVCYAAKRLKNTYRSEASIQACAEIVAAQKIPNHPNVVNMLEYHYDIYTGKLTFIFELMDMSMHDYLKTKRRGLSEHRVKFYLFQILKGLEHLHKHGLFHRDIKPENILIKFPSILYAPLSQTSSEEIVKVGDLGSVRGIFSSPPYTEYISTRWYRSPECLLTVGNYGPKMDVWATGCVFYEMLTLRPLFPGSNEIDQLCKIHHILGSPSLQLIARLKSRSRNFICFPKIKGTGFYNLLPYISRNGRNILNLMVEYDWDKRINVKRLLRHCYFDDIKEKLVWDESVSKSTGDDKVNAGVDGLIKKKILKREHFSDEIRNNSSNQIVKPKVSRKVCVEDASKATNTFSRGRRSKNSSKGSDSDKSSYLSSRNSINDVPYYHKISRRSNNGSKELKVTSLPLVDYKVRNSAEHKIIHPKEPPKRGQHLLKASSNLENTNKYLFKNPYQPYFESRSFYIPRNSEVKTTKQDTKESKFQYRLRKNT
ncbi:MAPK/MAK/MRK overlapping kinase-like [Diabrotica virgifera virgifera]|uniref:Protein kinase domain-containing protein n=1 Tax=Diabrotica virgifera virgifera TaxID=50390 RepID=A0ABM5JYU1_DIAVI|nr:MAPK/MAK/MRK overlapping kinase-like [Diabrotica virgifera virgifera]